MKKPITRKIDTRKFRCRGVSRLFSASQYYYTQVATVVVSYYSTYHSNLYKYWVVQKVLEYLYIHDIYINSLYIYIQNIDSMNMSQYYSDPHPA